MAESARMDVPLSVESPRSARGFVTDQMQRWGYAPIASDAALVTSELVTNAVQHASEPFALEIVDLHNGVVVTVEDAGNELPLPRNPGPAVMGGRGLFIVDFIAAAWGAWRIPDAGKFVWFRVAAL